MRTRFAWLLALAVIASPLHAVAGEACDAWLPDFNCNRSGRFEGFHQPIVAPFLFEDPFITTSVTPYFLWHDFPENSAFDGGSLYAAAVQARVALTDRVALIATKDGFVWNRNGQDLLSDSQGFLNLAAGVKVSLYEDEEAGGALAGVLRIEVPTGASDQYQGHSGALLMPSVTGALRTGPINWMADFGGQIPLDNEPSSMLFYHLYAGLDLTPCVQPFVQISGVSWVGSGDGSLPMRLKSGEVLTLTEVQDALNVRRFEGADVMNLGSEGVRGSDLVTAAVGVHVPIADHVTFSVAWERPISEVKGIFEQRVTSAFVLEF